MFNRLFTRNDAKYRLLRTIIQGVIGVLIANLDVIFGMTPIPTEVRALIVAVTMAVLSPIMAELGTHEMPDKEDLPEDYFEEGEDK